MHAEALSAPDHAWELTTLLRPSSRLGDTPPHTLLPSMRTTSRSRRWRRLVS